MQWMTLQCQLIQRSLPISPLRRSSRFCNAIGQALTAPAGSTYRLWRLRLVHRCRFFILASLPPRPDIFEDGQELSRSPSLPCQGRIPARCVAEPGRCCRTSLPGESKLPPCKRGLPSLSSSSAKRPVDLKDNTEDGFHTACPL